MSLEIALGPGATAAFEAAVTFPDDTPTIVYGDWEYKPVSLKGMPAIPDGFASEQGSPWPGPGKWRTATVIWNDGVSQQVYFQDRVLWWGSGLCQAAPTDLDRMGNAAMWEFWFEFIDEMFIYVIPLPDLINPFLNIGFEVLDDNTLHAPIVAGGRMQQWVDWREAGKPADSEPNWRV